MEQNLPCYNGDVAYNPLFNGYRRSDSRINRMPLRSRLEAPVAGSPGHHQFSIIGVEQFLGEEHTWLGMYLTEPPITTARLTMHLSLIRGKTSFSRHLANELVHDARGLTFRTIMGRVNEACKSVHWCTPRGRLRIPGVARVRVELFAGT